MKKKLSLSVLLLFIVVTYFIYRNKQYEQFYPVVYNVTYDEILIDDVNKYPKFYENLEKVLTYYKEDYKKKSGVIYVRKSLYKNLSLCWNYTSKANDKVWLHSRE